MKKLIPLTIVLSSVLSISAFAASANETTFPCPTGDQVSVRTSSQGGVTYLTGYANPTTNMPQDLGSWQSPESTRTVGLTFAPVPPTFKELRGVPVPGILPYCVFQVAAFDYANQPTSVEISVVPNGTGVHNYLYSGNSAAITAVGKPSSK